MSTPISGQLDSLAPTKREKLLAECRQLKDSGNYVEAIRKYRSETGEGLYEAKKALEGE